MKILEKLSYKFNLTLTELKIFLFLFFALIVGMIINIWKSNHNSNYLDFDYSEQDSLFYNSFDNIADNDSIVGKNEVDTIQTLKTKKENLITLKKQTDNIIKINFATAEEISQLPGIGIKTANNIIEYRIKKGRINNADELLNIKGIGKSKLEKIRMLLNFDK